MGTAPLTIEVSFPTWLRRRRRALGLTQNKLAELASVARPNIVAIETGRRPAGDQLRLRLETALIALPSDLLDLNRARVLEIVERHGFGAPRVFGSCAHYSDHPDSDIDLIVNPKVDRKPDLIDKVRLVRDLEAVLSCPVDVIIDTGRNSLILDRARNEALAL